MEQLKESVVPQFHYKVESSYIPMDLNEYQLKFYNFEIKPEGELVINLLGRILFKLIAFSLKRRKKVAQKALWTLINITTRLRGPYNQDIINYTYLLIDQFASKLDFCKVMSMITKLVVANQANSHSLL